MFSMAVELAVGLCYIHDNDMIHRNLKLANVAYLSQRPNFLYQKIKDYGLTRDTLSSMLNFGSNDFPFYDAPEILEDQAFTQLSDVWAFGCMMYEMMNKKPFLGKSAYEVAKKILKEDPAELPISIT